MVYRASRETHSISALRFASTCFPSKDPLPRREAHRKSPQGLPHRLQALQDTPLANNPPGPRTTSSQANRMLWRLPATVVLLLYLSPISLSPHPVSRNQPLPHVSYTRYTCHPPHTQTHTPRHNHTPRTASRDTIRRHHTPPYFATHTHSQIGSLMHSQSDTRRYSGRLIVRPFISFR